jgi:tRNA(Ile2) C34 agmatinyltransferase TiaS
MIFIGIDDTDTLQSRGTGRLARQIASFLAEQYIILGVTRHQLLVDPRVPYTKNNSSAAISLVTNHESDLHELFDRVRQLMLNDYQEGSDPGLCIASKIPPAVIQFGQLAKRDFIDIEDALRIASENALWLAGLGGTNAGVIGALAAVGLAGSGEDGRYIQVGSIRELSGLVPVHTALEAGISAIKTMDGTPVTGGLIQAEKIRPARRKGRPVQYVIQEGEHWQPLKLD